MSLSSSFRSNPSKARYVHVGDDKIDEDDRRVVGAQRFRNHVPNEVQQNRVLLRAFVNMRKGCRQNRSFYISGKHAQHVGIMLYAVV